MQVEHWKGRAELLQQQKDYQWLAVLSGPDAPRPQNGNIGVSNAKFVARHSLRRLRMQAYIRRISHFQYGGKARVTLARQGFVQAFAPESVSRES